MRFCIEAAFTPFSDARIDKAEVTTLFVYLCKTVVKFQRITGTRSGAEAHIRFRANSSYGGPGMQSLILIDSGSAALQVARAYTDADHIGTLAQGYVSFVHAQVECLIISRYEEFPKTDDYLLVDMSRFSRENRGALGFAVASVPKKMQPPQVWQMRHSRAIREGELPVSFRALSGFPLDGLAGVEQRLQPWLQASDIWLSQEAPTAAHKLLRHILSEFAEAVGSTDNRIKCVDIPTLLSSKGQSYSLAVRDIKDTTVLLFNWV